MKEETNTVQEQAAQEPQADKLPKSKRTALVRYIAILFVFAFALVLLSLFLEYRSTSETTISELTSASRSAIARAEQLQEENRRLEQKVADMEKDAAKAREAHEKELADEKAIYDALVRLLSAPVDPANPDDPKLAEDVNTVNSALDRLSESAKAAFIAYTDEIENSKTAGDAEDEATENRSENKKTEEAKHD